MSPTRVLVVDDDPLVRTGLTMMLGGDPRLEVVGEAADGLEAQDRVRELAPDIVLMDIRMPRCDGLEATAAVRALPDPPEVLVLTTFDADDMVLRALRAGASGFLLKDTPPPRIVEAVLRVHAGEPMFSPSAGRRLVAAVAASAPDASEREAVRLVAGLTDREREVALAVGRGLTNADIAAELYLSVATVKAHLTHVMTKLGAGNRVQIAIRMHDAGLL